MHHCFIVDCFLLIGFALLIIQLHNFRRESVRMVA